MPRIVHKTISSPLVLKYLFCFVALIAVFGLMSGCSEESLQEPAVDLDASADESKFVVDPENPLPLYPTGAEQVDLLERLLVGDDLTQSDVLIMNYFNEMYIEPLSQPSKDAMTAFLDEVAFLNILTYEYEARWDELVTPTTPEFQAYADELEALLDFTCLGKDGGATIIAGIALVGAAIGCGGKAEACMDDSLDNQKACFRQQCPVGEKPDIDCCTDEALEDISNCAWSCGLNCPDPEYNSNCCVKHQSCLLCHIRPISHHYGYQPSNNKAMPPGSEQGTCTR